MPFDPNLPVDPDQPASKPKFDPTKPVDSDGLADFLKRGVGAITAARNGIVKGATFGTVDPDKMVDKKLQDMSEGHVQGGLEQNSQEHPLASAAGQAAGAGGTVAAGGMGLEALIPGILGKTAAAGGTVAKTAAQAAPVIAALKYMLHR